MCNRCKRRPLLILLFLIHIILISIYILVHYQSNDSHEEIKNNPLTVVLVPEQLPANLIEKSDRSLLDKNYRKSKVKQVNATHSKEKLESLNVSFVSDNDRQRSIIQCSILPGNLGNFLYEYREKATLMTHANITA